MTTSALQSFGSTKFQTLIRSHTLRCQPKVTSGGKGKPEPLDTILTKLTKVYKLNCHKLLPTNKTSTLISFLSDK